jgi:hypothetical protein
MGLFKRKNKDEQPRTCPDCSQIVAADATTCDLCGADLTATPAPAPGTPAMVPGGVERYR